MSATENWAGYIGDRAGTGPHSLADIADMSALGGGPTREAPVKVALATLLASGKELHGVLAELEARLAPVLRPALPGLSDLDKDGPAAPPVAPLTDGIQTAGHSTRHASMCLRSILARLEL